MRFMDIISIGLDYLWLGVLAAIVIGIIFTVWYFLYFKKKYPGKKLHKGKILLWGIFFVYLVVVFGATMLSRGNFYGNTKIYPLFYSYKDAWNDFSITGWRNIILNILMFVPLGFLMPVLVKWTDSFLKVSGIGFGVTLVIESSQLLLKRGVFEPDDLLGNTVGTMIGFGMYRLIKYVVCIKKKKEHDKIGQVLWMQIPLVVTMIAFGGIFLIYYFQEFGNLKSTYILKQKNIAVTGESNFDKDSDTAIVYKAAVLTKEDTKAFVGKLFSKLGYSIDESRTDIYEHTAIYYSNGEDGNRFNIWMEYDGGVFTFRDFDKLHYGEQTVEEKMDATEEEIRAALDDIGIFVPKEAVFKNKEDGNYNFMADRLVDENKIYDGYIECVYYEDGQFGEINYQMLTLEAYKTVEIISEAEAQAQIKDGKFHYWRQNDGLLEIEIIGVERGYEMDTKGFYQPVYLFDAVVDDFKTQITIPAIK